jgi:hypothetical protein
MEWAIVLLGLSVIINVVVLWSRNFKTTMLEKQLAGLEEERAKREGLLAAHQALLVAILHRQYTSTPQRVPEQPAQPLEDEKETLGGFYDEEFLRGTFRSDPPKKD